jgi:LPS-assembly lipoprotein
MSSSDRRSRRMVLLALGLAPTLFLGGCFRPMYATPADGSPALTDKLALVDVSPAHDRVTQQVRNALTFSFSGGSATPPPKYVLHLTVAVSGAANIVDSRANTPEIDTVIVSGTYVLTPVDSEVVLLDGKAFARKSYDRGLQRFAALRAARDAENDAAALVADQIKTRLAIFLSSRP